LQANQCWIAVRFKKIPSVAKISQSPEASAREEMRANEFHCRRRGEYFIFLVHGARHHRKFWVAPSLSVSLLLRLKPFPRAEEGITPSVPSRSRPHCLHSFARNAGLGNDPTNRAFYVRSLREQLTHESIATSEWAWTRRSSYPAASVNRPHTTCPFPGRLRLCTSTQFSTVPVALIFDGLCHLLAMVLGSARPAERGIFRTGEAAMAKVLNEILLFSSMAVFVTGIVLAAARLLI
jgi:hypothetical protein